MFNITEMLMLNEVGKLTLAAHIHLEPIKGINKFVLEFSHGTPSYCEEVKIDLFWSDSDSIGLASDNAIRWLTRNLTHITSHLTTTLSKSCQLYVTSLNIVFFDTDKELSCSH